MRSICIRRIVIQSVEVAVVASLRVRSATNAGVKSVNDLDNYRRVGFVTIRVCAVPKQLSTIHRVYVALKHCSIIVPKIMKWNATVTVYRARTIRARVFRTSERNGGRGWAPYRWCYRAYGAIGRCVAVSRYVLSAMPDIRGMDVNALKRKFRTVGASVAVAMLVLVASVVVVWAPALEVALDERLAERATIRPISDCSTLSSNYLIILNQCKHVTKDCKRSLLNFRNFLINFNNYKIKQFTTTSKQNTTAATNESEGFNQTLNIIIIIITKDICYKLMDLANKWTVVVKFL